MTVQLFRTLLGDLPATVTARGIVEALPLSAWAPDDRPYLVINMAMTLDGRTTIDGRAGPIGGRADRELFHHLRTRGDAVMAGASTIRVEGYGRLIHDDELHQLRGILGSRPHPLAVVASRSLRLPAEAALLREPRHEVAIVTQAQSSLPETAARVVYLRGSLREGLRTLRLEHGIRSIVCEGGAHLNASLIPAGLADELFVSIAPKLVGGADPLTILAGAGLAQPLETELLWLLEADGELFARYGLPGRHPAGKARARGVRGP